MSRVALALFAATVGLAACQPEAPAPLPAPVPAPAVPVDEAMADKEVLVATEPSGAKVILKGAEVGTTPMKLMVRGNTNVVLEKEGYVRQALLITPESEPNQVVQLVPAGEGEEEPKGDVAVATKSGGKGKKSASKDAEPAEPEVAAEPAPAPSGCTGDQDCKGDRVCTEGKCVTPAPKKPAAPAKKTYTTMKQIKTDYKAGKITKADYAYWQSVLKQKRNAEIQKLKADYKGGTISKAQYKQMAQDIKKKYEG